MKKFLLFLFAMSLFTTASIAADVGINDVLPVKSLAVFQQSYEFAPIAVTPVNITIPIVIATPEYTITPNYLFVSVKGEPIYLIDPGRNTQVSVINKLNNIRQLTRYAKIYDTTTRHVSVRFS